MSRRSNDKSNSRSQIHEKSNSRSQIHSPAEGLSPDSNASWRGNPSNQRPKTSQVPLAPIDENGFTLVSRPKGQTARIRTDYGRPQSSKASAAAVSRANVYGGPKPNKSLYKQSCLPVEQRDSVLAEAERSKGIKLPKEAFKPGTIIRAVLHEQDFQGVAGTSEVTRADKYQTDSVYGRIYTKTRKMIVLATFEDNYLAVPLYTHNGRGLEGKPKPQEFVSVRDHRRPGPFTQLSIHRPLVTEHLNAGIELFHLKSTAHVTYPVSRKYTLPVVLEGRLTQRSVDQLAELFGEYISPFVKFVGR